jgi:hypothetical protein
MGEDRVKFIESDDEVTLCSECDGTGAKTGWPYAVDREDEPYDPVNRPKHYCIGKYEVIDVIEDWFPDEPHLFSAVQYLARARHKGQFKQDLEKAIWYIQRRLAK